MDPVLKIIVRVAAGIAVAQGVVVADLTNLAVPSKIIAGVLAAVGLAGLVAEFVVDTATSSTPTPTKPPAA